MIEYQHRCDGGGNDVRLECGQGWRHGETVLIVSKREFLEKLMDWHRAVFLKDLPYTASSMKALIEQIEELP